jgi:putative oxidoreductase
MTTATTPSSSIRTSPSTAPAKPGKALTIALWVVQIGLAAMFFMAGGNKLGGNAMMVGLFDAIGIGQWFRYLTGLLEVAGAALLLVPRASGLGAALLVPVMLGAILTHLVVLHSSPAMPAALLVGVLFVAWGRRAQIVAFLQRFAG